MTNDIEVLVPHAYESEIAIIGCIISNNDVLDRCIQQIKYNDFYDYRNQLIYKTCVDLYQKQILIDKVSLIRKFKDLDILNEVGGEDYIDRIMFSSFYSSNINQYCKFIKEKSLLRKLIFITDNIKEKCMIQKEDVENIVSHAENSIFELTQQSLSKGLTKVSETMEDTITRLNEMSINKGELPGIETGFKRFDQVTSGLQSSQFILLAARPAMGKTALGLNIAWNIAKKGKIVAFFSLEMSNFQLNQRLLSLESFIDLKSIITGNIEDDHWTRIIDSAKNISTYELYIDETPAISLSELRSKVKRLKAEKGLDLVVIDYLQLMTVNQRYDNRQQEISIISKGLKSLSKEIDCPVFSLAQLSREADKRSDHRPILSDLRESGSIEQDADIVALLYRNDYYNPEDKPNIANIIIAKNRHGETSNIEMFFKKENTMFVDLTRNDNEQ